MKNNRPQNASEILDALIEFTTPSHKEILEMSSEEIKSELEEEGINVNETVENLLNVVKQNQSRSTLLLAKKERERKLAQIRNIINSIVEKADVTKDELLSELKSRFKFDNEKFLIFYRKFEEASNEDVRSLIEDLELLNLLVEMDNE